MKNNIITGTIWSFIERFGGLAINFVSNIILARLLCPEDFGVVGMVMIFVSIADSFVDGGLGNAIIQKKDITNKDVSTVFTSNFVVSIIFFTLFFIIAPYIESYTKIHNLGLFIRVESILILIRAFLVIPLSLARKSLLFKDLAIINLVCSIVAVSSSIIMAYMGYGIWSILCRNIILDALLTILAMRLIKFFPKFGFNKYSFNQLFNFGFFVLISNIVEAIYAHAITFVIGKKYSVKQLGYYNQAYSLQQIPVYSITSVLNSVLFPYFSKIQNDDDLVKERLRISIEVLTFFVFPILTFLALCSEEVITIIYSEKWLPCVPYFQLFCIAGLFNGMIHINRSVLKSKGYSKLIFNIQITNTVIGIVLLILGVYFGILYVVILFVVNTILLFVLTAYYSGRISDYNIICQLKSVLPNFVISMVSIGVCYWFSIIELQPIVSLLLCGIIFCSTYIALHCFFKTRAMTQLRIVITNYRNKK